MNEKKDTALQVVVGKVNAFLEKAQAVKRIRTQEDRRLVAALLVTNKDLQEQIHAELDPLVQSAHETWQGNLALRRKHLEPLEKEERLCKAMQNTDRQEQAEAAEKKRAELQAKADAKAKEDRKAEVAALEKTGQGALAKELAAAPVQAAAVVVANKAEAVAAEAGVVFRVQKHLVVTDEAALERKYLVANMDAIKAAGAAIWERVKPKDNKDAAAFAVAAAQYAACTEIPGVRFSVTKESAMGAQR